MCCVMGVVGSGFWVLGSVLVSCAVCGGLLYVLYVRGYGLCDLLSNAFGKRSIMYCMLRAVG